MEKEKKNREIQNTYLMADDCLMQLTHFLLLTYVEWTTTLHPVAFCSVEIESAYCCNCDVFGSSCSYYHTPLHHIFILLPLFLTVTANL